jgi:hypothetical protein
LRPGVVGREHRFWLDRVRDNAVVDDPDRNDLVRGRECSVDRDRVADAVDRSDVPVLGCEGGGPVRRRVRARGVDGLDDRREILPLDLHELRGILRLVAGFGDHHRIGIADEPRRVGGERIARRGDDRRAVGPLVHLRER